MAVSDSPSNNVAAPTVTPAHKAQNSLATGVIKHIEDYTKQQLAVLSPNAIKSMRDVLEVESTNDTQRRQQDWLSNALDSLDRLTRDLQKIRDTLVDLSAKMINPPSVPERFNHAVQAHERTHGLVESSGIRTIFKIGREQWRNRDTIKAQHQEQTYKDVFALVTTTQDCTRQVLETMTANLNALEQPPPRGTVRGIGHQIRDIARTLEKNTIRFEQDIRALAETAAKDAPTASIR